MTVTQGDLTMEECEDLEDQLIAVRDELFDRDEDPELVDWSTNLWNGCTTPTLRNSPTMLGQPSFTFTTFGAVLGTSISRSTTAMRMSPTRKTSERITASLHSSTALLFGALWCPCAGTRAGPHHAEEELELVVPPPWGTLNIPGGYPRPDGVGVAVRGECGTHVKCCPSSRGTIRGVRAVVRPVARDQKLSDLDLSPVQGTRRPQRIRLFPRALVLDRS